MIFEISNYCKDISNCFISSNINQSQNETLLLEKIQSLQESLKEFDFWFKTQFNNEELLVNYIYTELLEVRKINKVVQFKKIDEKSSEIKGLSIDSQKSAETQSSICSAIFRTNYRTYSKKLQKKGSLLMELLNNNKEEQINQSNLQTPPKSYSLDKIYYVINFEINCLKQYEITGDEELQLQKIQDKEVLRWILETVQAKNHYKQILQCLINSAQDLANYQTEDFTQAFEKMNCQDSSFTNDEYKRSISNQSFYMNQDAFKQLIVDKIKQNMSQQNEKNKKQKQKKTIISNQYDTTDSKVCMCSIF
ncbi:unnamed protein product (macronuclear) [Paramecium tetraurelia]|uniref:Uncharacterized protein n=1 Tax=Paramecium tetraurelia TaxID=5888 RepID=A0C9A7_PARTE|nr:uncharacterized protein GSPATT00006680001 [Paramecium tetraurelia]CAK67374.1 unnamed protein product [Paramecium tetraurelia]|eukprot:XP_001434771.1 hypothetical protein (macronuclear) [Paramecium tetraurelia strain d4-2]